MPLVLKKDNQFIVYDGNRRITCLKYIQNPDSATEASWKRFFLTLKKEWKNDFLDTIQCELGTDETTVNEIIFRRHNGTNNRIGQLSHDEDAKIRQQKVTNTYKLNIGNKIKQLFKNDFPKINTSSLKQAIIYGSNTYKMWAKEERQRALLYP